MTMPAAKKVAKVLLVSKSIEKVLAILKTKNLYVEGIFRLNGNIKKVKDLSDALDKDPGLSEIKLDDENEIQLAAVVKKFLREMPEPLLTFKLYKLFVSITSPFEFM